MDTEPFRFDLDPAAVADLRDRLHRTRWPDQIPGTTWEYGADRETVRELCAHWADGYDFDAFAARLNAFPQLVADVDGRPIHCYDVPAADDPDGADATRLPLLLLHGWPGSVAELLDVVGPLTDPAAHGLEGVGRRVVVPSLPGYGFSGSTAERGMAIDRVGALLDVLMQGLGIDRYLVHGGDWGSHVAPQLAAVAPDRVAGIHITMLSWWPPAKAERVDLDDEAQRSLDLLAAFARTETGYQAIQGTKPQTLGYGLTDSPAGLAAWVLEKFSTWTDGDADPTSTIDRDRLLDNLSIYWFTATINSSMRLYFESKGAGGRVHAPDVVCPVGFAQFPGEPFVAPERWARERLPIVRWTRMERGGHFPGLECPLDLAREVQAFCDQVAPG